MTEPALNYEHIVVDVEGIYLDGVMISTYAVKPDVKIHHGSVDAGGPTITLTIRADKIEVSDRMKEALATSAGSITETHGEQDVICHRTYTAAKCVHTSRDGKLMEGSCDD